MATNQEPDIEGSDDPEPTLWEILAAVTSCNHTLHSLTSEIKGVKFKITLVRQDMQKLRDCTVALEGRVSMIEDDMAPLQSDMRHVQSLTSAHAAKLEDMENRLRRNNIRAVGIPERAEGKNPVAFIEHWLTETFGREPFSQMFSVERAHRVPAILYLARTKGEAMKMDNTRMSFYPEKSGITITQGQV